MHKTLTASVRDANGAWEIVTREPASISSLVVGDVTVKAMAIGGLYGQQVLVELRDENDQALDAVEIVAT